MREPGRGKIKRERGEKGGGRQTNRETDRRRTKKTKKTLAQINVLGRRGTTGTVSVEARARDLLSNELGSRKSILVDHVYAQG